MGAIVKEGRGVPYETLFLSLAVLAIVVVFGATAAYAGTDATFDTALTKFTDFLEGSGGKIITVLSLAGGLVALASGRFSLGQVAVPVAAVSTAGTSCVPESVTAFPAACCAIGAQAASVTNSSGRPISTARRFFTRVSSDVVILFLLRCTPVNRF